MIDPECFTKAHLASSAGAIGSRAVVMLEKAVVALQLLGYLAEAGLPFQFKGGTSLLLRIAPIRRLSIDIDIVTQATPETLAAALDLIATQSPFTRYEHNARRDKDLPPKKHYNLYYPSAISQAEDHILLDVLFEDAAPNCSLVRIATDFITPLRNVDVMVPTTNSLLGDKLTAFAPNTIGILYKPERKMDIVKQLFDVAALFDVADDLVEAADTYAAVHAKQLGYRQLALSQADTLDDTINAAYMMAQLGLKGNIIDGNATLLHEGVKSLANHLVNFPFHIDEARIAAGKAACAAAWIKKRPAGVTIADLRYDREKIQELALLEIAAPWQTLIRLRGANPEAFYYWHRAQSLLR